MHDFTVTLAIYNIAEWRRLPASRAWNFRSRLHPDKEYFAAASLNAWKEHCGVARLLSDWQFCNAWSPVTACGKQSFILNHNAL
jgi:hypothetical protein